MTSPNYATCIYCNNPFHLSEGVVTSEAALCDVCNAFEHSKIDANFMFKFKLTPVIRELVEARNKLRKTYMDCGLNFTLDGNLVGDLGEAISSDIFGIRLSKRSAEGIDGISLDGRSVQVKATGTGRGPVFRDVKTRADHLLFFDFDYENLCGLVVFNGPEEIALRTLKRPWVGQRSVTRRQIEVANKLVFPEQRLSPIMNDSDKHA